MILAKVTGDKETVQYFLSRSTGVHKEIETSIGKMVLKLQVRIVSQKLRGQVLKNRTGRLWRSITPEQKTALAGRVFTNVEYARIHEYGGTIKHPGGTAFFIGKDGRAVFVSNKSRIANLFRRRTAKHDIKMPLRSFMRTALAEMRPEIVEELKQAVGRALK
jgi:phage gpG-like protein